MNRTNLAGLSLIAAMLVAGAADAKQWRYAGMHPRTGEPKDGMCHIEVTHVHVAQPVHAELLYRVHDGVHIFIGDPTPFAYEGPKHAFYGHHPVVLELVIGEEDDQRDVAYCYHDGPHYHMYEPPPDVEFVEREDVHYYAGEYPEEYKRDSPKLTRVNKVYKPMPVVHPVVHEAPPPEYHGPIVQVTVGVPLPHVDVSVNVPGVQVTVPGLVVVPAGHVVHEHHVVHGDHKHEKHKHKKHKHKKFKGRD